MRVQPIRSRYIHGDWQRLTNYSRAHHLFQEYANCAHGRVRSLTDAESMAACNERLTPPQRIVMRIIRNTSTCPHGPVVSQFYCPAPYFYLPRDVGTCLSLSTVCGSEEHLEDENDQQENKDMHFQEQRTEHTTIFCRVLESD